MHRKFYLKKHHKQLNVLNEMPSRMRLRCYCCKWRSFFYFQQTQPNSNCLQSTKCFCKYAIMDFVLYQFILHRSIFNNAILLSPLLILLIARISVMFTVHNIASTHIHTYKQTHSISHYEPYLDFIYFN